MIRCLGVCFILWAVVMAYATLIEDPILAVKASIGLMAASVAIVGAMLWVIDK